MTHSVHVEVSALYKVQIRQTLPQAPHAIKTRSAGSTHRAPSLKITTLRYHAWVRRHRRTAQRREVASQREKELKESLRNNNLSKRAQFAQLAKARTLRCERVRIGWRCRTLPSFLRRMRCAVTSMEVRKLPATGVDILVDTIASSGS